MLAVNGVSGVVVLLHYRAFQRQAGENALGARVSQHFGVHLPVSSGGSVTTDRPRGNRSLAREFKLARQKMLQTLVVHDQHDQIYVFDSNLQSPASSAN